MVTLDDDVAITGNLNIAQNICVKTPSRTGGNLNILTSTDGNQASIGN